MGEHEVRSLPCDPVFNGLLGEEIANVTRALDEERWLKAEERTADLLACIQPNLPSEERRNAIADYVRRLIMKCFSCKVFTYGSVPLKTYLPDGDIDLTAFSKDGNLKETLAIEVREVLENEEKSENAEFCVKEVQYIQAEVKIIKCLVENIVVDISFNQIGGLCTLCFLEQVDHLISQNHLFKRSIILIKAWCYYESRILGAHHGLISTYALEILVLYIFHVFNNSFAGPLEVLYRFLQFFSQFNWDNFCVSLWGPIPISSLPDMTAESPRKDGSKLLLSGELLKTCDMVYTVLPSGQESQGQQFVSKHFNVIDPLRTNNNLGRSVSKGNFYRIRSAFAFGAKRLARLLDCPKEDLIAEVNQFFMNTWQRHRSGNRTDAPAPAIRYLQPVLDDPAKEFSHLRGSASLLKSTECFPNAYRTTNSFMDSHSSSQKFYTNRIGSTDSDHVERANYSSQEGQGSSNFARTQSSSALVETPTDDHSQTRLRRVVETGRSRRNTNLDISDIQTARVSFEVGSNSKSVSKSCHDDTSFTIVAKEVASVSEAQDLQQQEQQDFANRIASSQAHNFIGHVELPMHFASHSPVALPPFLASVGYAQRNLVTLINPSLGSTMQFPQGFISSQPPQCISDVNTLKSNFEGLTVNESSCMTSMNQENSDVGSTGGLLTDSGEFSTLQFDGRQHSSAGHFNYVHSSSVNYSGATVNEGCPNTFQQQTSGANDIIIADRNVNMRQFPMIQVRDGPEHTKSTGNKWGRYPFSSDVENSILGKPCGEWEFEAASEDASSQEDDESGDWISTTTSTTNISEHAVSYAPLVSTHSRSQLPGYYEHVHIRGADSMIPLPVLLGVQQKMVNGSGVLPFSFYPTGPPVPLLTMVPVYNFPTHRVSFHGSMNQVENDNGVRHFFPTGENFGQFNHLMNLSISEDATPCSSEELKPDVLNSDFASHWQNLQYGRFCQNARSSEPFIYSPILVPQAYIHGHFPMDGPGRPYSANVNFTPITSYGPRFVQVASIQPGSCRPYGVYNRFGDESPKYRGGTGTYLPNPASFRERQFSNTRKH